MIMPNLFPLLASKIWALSFFFIFKWKTTMGFFTCPRVTIRARSWNPPPRTGKIVLIPSSPNLKMKVGKVSHFMENTANSWILLTKAFLWNKGKSNCFSTVQGTEDTQLLATPNLYFFLCLLMWR